MTNRGWIAALDEFEKTVAIVNFVREIPEKLQDDKETVKKLYREWLELEVK